MGRIQSRLPTDEQVAPLGIMLKTRSHAVKRLTRLTHMWQLKETWAGRIGVVLLAANEANRRFADLLGSNQGCPISTGHIANTVCGLCEKFTVRSLWEV